MATTPAEVVASNDAKKVFSLDYRERKDFTYSDLNSSSMLNLAYLDPPKYGWTAIGGIASILAPHEMARRPEAKKVYLEQQTKNPIKNEAKREEMELVCATSEKENSIGDAQMNDPSKNGKEDFDCLGKNGGVNISEKMSCVPQSPHESRCSSKRVKVGHGSHSSSDEKLALDDPAKSDENEAKEPPLKKISVQSTNEDGVLDIFTYHRGRVGLEPRDEKTGELSCDTDPVDSNHEWVPSKAIAKITIEFPLGDPDEDEEDGDADDFDNGNRDSVSDDDSDDEINQKKGERRTSRARHRRVCNQNQGNRFHSDENVRQSKAQTVLPHYHDIIEWDLGDPSTPTSTEFAANIGAEFGLSFSQTMELADSIEKQLNDFTRGNFRFYAPVTACDPYGNERPRAHFGEPEILAQTEDARRFVNPRAKLGFNRHNPGSKSGTGARAGRSRPTGPVYRDKKDLEALPIDELPDPRDAGGFRSESEYVDEVLNRSKTQSKAIVADMLSKGEPALWFVKDEVCHICHKRKADGLTFNCGKHTYCDFHCATRLGFRVAQYDPKVPSHVPVDYCPVCAVWCTCAKCRRRLDDVSAQMKVFCREQKCGPESVEMDTLELCSGIFKFRDGIKPPVKKEIKKVKKPDSYNEDFDPNCPVPSVARSMTRSSPDFNAGSHSGAAHRKSNRKGNSRNELDTQTTVKKVHPSEFPKELCGVKDMDPSEPDDYNKVFTPEGSFLVDNGSENASCLHDDKSNYQKIIVNTDDRNFNECIVCKQEGDLILCDQCPRAYHFHCLARDGCNVDLKSFPNHWVCHRCESDMVISGGNEFPEINHEQSNLQSLYSEFSSSRNFSFHVQLLNQIIQILNKLKSYDFGYLFAVPVDCELVSDYLDIIKNPIDYGTIISNLRCGKYTERVTSGDRSQNPEKTEKSAMEEILVAVLCDIEQIFFNCHLYNANNSLFYRAGDVQLRKWRILYQNSIMIHLGDDIKNDVIKFLQQCQHELREDEKSDSSRSFQVKGDNNPLCKAISVFDPDTKRIVKQYSSKVRAAAAVRRLKEIGYECEFSPTDHQVKQMIKVSAQDPSRLLFGYRWLCTEDLKKGNFKIKDETSYISSEENLREIKLKSSPVLRTNDFKKHPHQSDMNSTDADVRSSAVNCSSPNVKLYRDYFRDDDLASPTPYNIVILKEDNLSGAKLQGFESDFAAYEDWLKCCQVSINPPEGSSIDDFRRQFLDEGQSLDGVVWNRVKSGLDSYDQGLQKPGKMILEQMYAPPSSDTHNVHSIQLDLEDEHANAD